MMGNALPSQGEHWHERERAHQQAVHKFEETMAKFRTDSDKPFLAGVHTSLGSLYGQHGRPDDAEREFRKAIELFEQKPGEVSQRVYCYLKFANFLSGTGRIDEAKDMYNKVLSIAPNDSKTMNSIAWTLATAPVPDAARAVDFGKRAVKVAPQDGSIRNTLGVAQYRAGDWQGAIESLSKSLELQKANEGYDWFFLAMAHWQLGHKDEARKWYSQAVEWMDKKKSKNEELDRFRAEAAKLLGISDPAETTEAAAMP
jgi:tetratricopeptide (TPR) repeat protein